MICNFFLHDLLHEILTPGSTNSFKEKDEQFAGNQEETLEEMKNEREFKDSWDEDEESNEYFSASPRFELNQEVYTLEDFIEEQVAEALTNKNKIASNGLEKYVKTTLIGLINQHFEKSFPQVAYEFETVFKSRYFKWDNIYQFFRDVTGKVISDTSQVKNPKYKNLAEKFCKSFLVWLRNLETELEKSFEENDEISIDDLVDPLLHKTKQWIGANFNIRQEKFKIFDRENVEFEPNEFGEKPISDLTDDFKMSIARRWLLAVDKEVDKMIYQSM